MVSRTTINVSLTPELDAFLTGCVESGRYQSASEVVRDALSLLERHEEESGRALQTLKRKLERGAAQAERGELIDGEAAFETLRERLEQRQRPSPANS